MTSLFVLVHGWPASGKTTVSAALAAELRLPRLAKDELKEALAESLGPPVDVEESRRLGRAAVVALLRVAAACPGAVVDSTFYDYALPAVTALPGRLVEVRCLAPLEVVRARYASRAAGRDGVHLDELRSDDELWGEPVLPLGVGPVVDVDTTVPLDVAALAGAVHAAR